MNISEEKRYIYEQMADISAERRRLTDIYYSLRERLDELFKLEAQGLEESSVTGYMDLERARERELANAAVQREMAEAKARVEQEIEEAKKKFQLEMQKLSQNLLPSQEPKTQAQPTEPPFYDWFPEEPPVAESDQIETNESPFHSEPEQAKFNFDESKEVSWNSPPPNKHLEKQRTEEPKRFNPELAETERVEESQEEVVSLSDKLADDEGSYRSRLAIDLDLATRKVQQDLKDPAYAKTVLPKETKKIPKAAIQETKDFERRNAKKKDTGRIDYKKVAGVIRTVLKEEGVPLANKDLFEKVNEKLEYKLSLENFTKNVIYRLTKDDSRIQRAGRGYYQFVHSASN